MNAETGEVYAIEVGKNGKFVGRAWAHVSRFVRYVVSDLAKAMKSDLTDLPRGDTCHRRFPCHSAVYRCVRTLSQIVGQRGARNTEMFATFAVY
ncbi:hypothetical protein GsuE55_35530 [Geobacillus subterraneus]|uniref:Uncharacterized protein n=1 Tax=Geobacillus subterraneus TaxID=129338 RepID=A0A679FRG2_9BACL|nr:hypothetical protein GsuE55_35530 [Geobacillus subterraneus]